MAWLPLGAPHLAHEGLCLGDTGHETAERRVCLGNAPGVAWLVLGAPWLAPVPACGEEERSVGPGEGRGAPGAQETYPGPYPEAGRELRSGVGWDVGIEPRNGMRMGEGGEGKIDKGG